MNATSSILAALTASDDSVDGREGFGVFALFFVGYAYFYFYLFPYTVGGR